MTTTQPPHTYEELCEVLRANLADYAPGQKRIATLLLDDASSIAVRSLSENAKAAGVHSSSVVRFAKALGFDGYPALARMCRKYLSEQARLIDRFDQATSQSTMSDRDETASPINAAGDPQSSRHHERNVVLSLSSINPNVWNNAVDAIANAHDLYIVGLQKCFAPAYLCAYLLQMARGRIHLLSETTGNVLSEIRDISPGDTLIAMSIRQYTAMTVRVVEQASANGGTIVAITDEPSSPLAIKADHTFIAQCESPYVFRSLSGITAIVESLAGEVSLRLGTTAREQLQKDDELFSRFGIYWTE
ncbi:transcriptional regulator [Bifidobacterium lemurum]|uniref:Transcriptional regulator n=1 Tax=Bifidobacterium lemurum TaxID=1603886 RepID=A0A261FKF5_9BIFI|nr:MurR/RpiR family transcriptional regulator [Bifidobacterium lemurum]OZG59558.1 transcriptional regulator [Bifidobacterium lemurum]QOL35016.1 MurR/RpiR family transcriptional regulator [Bifidobacterium lemurum]